MYLRSCPSYAVGDHSDKAIGWWLGLEANADVIPLLIGATTKDLSVPALPVTAAGVNTIAAVITDSAGTSSLGLSEVVDACVAAQAYVSWFVRVLMAP